MNGLIDIHSHILPLVDDGAESVEMALLMLKNGSGRELKKSYSLLIKKRIEDVLRRKEYSARMEELQELAVKRTHSGTVISGK